MTCVDVDIGFTLCGPLSKPDYDTVKTWLKDFDQRLQVDESFDIKSNNWTFVFPTVRRHEFDRITAYIKKAQFPLVAGFQTSQRVQVCSLSGPLTKEQREQFQAWISEHHPEVEMEATLDEKAGKWTFSFPTIDHRVLNSILAHVRKTNIPLTRSVQTRVSDETTPFVLK